MKQILGTNAGALVARMARPVATPGVVVIRLRHSLVSIGTEIAPMRSVLAANALAAADQEEEARLREQADQVQESKISQAMIQTTKVLSHLKSSVSLAVTYGGLAVRHPDKAVRRIVRITRNIVAPPQMVAEGEEQGRQNSLQAVAAAVGIERTDRDDQGWNLGYSAAGEVVEVGSGVEGFAIGDLVSCAGAGKANHAEYIAVPRNLVCRVPENVSTREAAGATIGAIAMQGVRRAAPQLGETVAVIGLGLIGQLTTQLLRANGCRVVCFDLDSSRVERAIEGTAMRGAAVAGDMAALVRDVTAGWGVDRTIVCAATKSHSPLNMAMELTRRKGTVVIVGDIGLSPERADFYRKEIDLLMSSSYGPGRYDRNYEEEGHDYPFPYVRWTINRNMQAYLGLVAEGKVSLEEFLDEDVPISMAPATYAKLINSDEAPPLGVSISYPIDASDAEPVPITLSGHIKAPRASMNYALVGAGAFGVSTIVPTIRKCSKKMFLKAVVSRDQVRGGNYARAEGVPVLASDISQVLDGDLDLIVIATRHNLHAEQACAALSAGKHVFVEKPLAINWRQLNAVVETYESLAKRPSLMIGFNRRFSPALVKLSEILEKRRSPLVITYRLNGGFIPPDHWIQGSEGGGRNIGEACHMYDVFRSLIGAPVTLINAVAINPGETAFLRSDNFSATLQYADGSIGNLVYTSLGPKEGLPKERIEIFCDGEAYIVDDYKSLTRARDGLALWEGDVDKGHFNEFKAFTSALLKGEEAPIPFDEIVETTAVSLHIEDMLHARG